MELQQFLRTRKPEASEKTMIGYVNNLKLLFNNITGKTGKNTFDMDEFNKFTTEELTECIMKESENKSKSYIRNMLSSLKAYTGDKSLTKLITDNSLEEKKDYENQEASESVKTHHLTQEQIDTKYKELEDIVEPLWKKEVNVEDFQKIQSFVMYALVCGKYICPRRSQDWVKMKIRNIDLDEDNYIDEKTFVFNKYKTAKSRGRQIIPIPPELYRILRKWIRYNQLEHLFVTVHLTPLTANSYAQRLNHIMGVPAGKTGGYSTNNFRHVYLTNKYSNTIDLEKDMTAMGSSIDCAKCYIKKL